jgi:hypothetical protein
MAANGGRSFNNSNFAGGNSSGQSYIAGTGIEIIGNTISNSGLVSLNDIPDADTNIRGLIGSDSNQHQYLTPKLHFNNGIFADQGMLGQSGSVGVIDNQGVLVQRAFNNYIQIEIDMSGYGTYTIANANTIKLLSFIFDDPSSITGNYLPPKRINRSNTSAIEIQFDAYTELSTTILNCTIAY